MTPLLEREAVDPVAVEGMMGARGSLTGMISSRPSDER
jgi:hypothetical protein